MLSTNRDILLLIISLVKLFSLDRELFLTYPTFTMGRNGYITVSEAAKLKGCSRQTIHYQIASGKLEAKAEKAIIWMVNKESLAKLELNPNMKRAGRKPTKRKAGK